MGNIKVIFIEDGKVKLMIKMNGMDLNNNCDLLEIKDEFSPCVLDKLKVGSG